MNKLRSLLSGDSPASNMIKLGGGTAIGQFFSVIALPLISRQYDPVQRGHFGIFTSYLAIVTVIAGLRYEMATPSADSDEEADQLLTISMIAVVVVSILAGIVLWALQWLHIGGYGNLEIWTPFVATMTLILTGAFGSLRFWYVRRADFGGISRAMVQQGFTRALVPILLGFLRFDWLGLALGELLGRVSGTASLARTASRNIHPKCLNRRTLVETARKHRAMPLQMMPSSLIDSMALSLPVPLVYAYFGERNAGYLSMALLTVAIPSGLITASVGDVFHQRLAELSRTNPSGVTTYLKSFSQKLFKISAAIYLPVAAFSYLFVEPILGENWKPLSWMLPALVPMVALSAIVSPLSRLLVIQNRVDLKLYADCVSLAASTIPVFVCFRFNLGFQNAFFAYCIANFLARIFYYAIIYRGSLPNLRSKVQIDETSAI